MRNGRKKINYNAPLESEDNFRIRTVTSSLGRSEGESGEFEPSKMRSYEVSEWFKTDISLGLDEAAVKRSRKKYGTNELYPYMRLSFLRSIRTQASGLMGLLFAAMCLIVHLFSPAPIYPITAAFIIVMMITNALIESRAAASLEEVKKHASLKSTVLRDGKVRIADSRALVPGDIVMLERGCIVPADARLIESNKLTVLETPLNGKQEPVFKSSLYINKGKEGIISRNMVYGGTIIASGTATAIVTATGDRLKIREGVSKSKEYRPQLLEYVSGASKIIVLSTIVLCFVAVFTGAVCEADIVRIFMLSLAASYVTLSDTVGAVCTAVLIGGIASMLKTGAAVRDLNCIQELCEVDTIMCDSANAFPVKRMRLESVFTGFHRYTATRNNRESIGRMLIYALACSDVKLEYATRKDLKKNKIHYVGTKLEIAVAKACREMGISLDAVRELYFKIESERADDNNVSRVLVLYEGKNYVIEKGAPEYIIRKCVDYEQSGTVFPLVESAANRFIDEAEDMADKSQHVIAVAFKEVKFASLNAVDSNDGMTFIGLLGLYTSIEMNAASAVYQCNNAGIFPVVRSDAPYATAVSLAKDAGIIASEEQAITGEDIYGIEYGLYVANSPQYRLYVNVSREQWEQVEKIHISNGSAIAFEAQTLEDLEQMAAAKVSFIPSDASNDTLKQCADVVLYKDGFNVITNVISRAKLIYRRIHSSVQYSIVAASAYMVAILIATISGLDIPFGIEQLLLCGGLINLAVLVSLGYMPLRRKMLMDRLPSYGKKPKLKDFLTPFIYGSGAAAIMLINYNVGVGYNIGLETSAAIGRTMAFVALSTALVLYSFVNLKRDGVLGDKAGKNAFIFISIAVFAVVVGASVYIPACASFFGMVSLDWRMLLLAFILPCVEFLILQTLREFLAVHRKSKSEKRHKRIFDFGSVIDYKDDDLADEENNQTGEIYHE